jgi:hypothetical protein
LPITIVDFFDPETDALPEEFEAEPAFEELLPQAATVASSGSNARTARRLLDNNFITRTIPQGLLARRHGANAGFARDRAVKAPSGTMVPVAG